MHLPQRWLWGCRIVSETYLIIRVVTWYPYVTQHLLSSFRHCIFYPISKWKWGVVQIVNESPRRDFRRSSNYVMTFIANGADVWLKLGNMSPFLLPEFAPYSWLFGSYNQVFLSSFIWHFLVKLSFATDLWELAPIRSISAKVRWFFNSRTPTRPDAH